MAGYSLIAWINYSKQAVISVNSQAANLPGVNVAGDSGSPSQGWQTVSGVVTSAAGALIQIQPLVAALPWDVIGLFRTNLTQGASVTVSLYTNPSTLVWTGTVGGPVAGYGQVIALPPAGTVADYVQIGFNDPTNPDGFINVPLVFCGAAWRPLGSASYATSTGRDATTTEATTRGGQEFPSLYYQRRRWSVSLEALRTSEVWNYGDILSSYASAGSNVLFIPDVTDGYVQQEAIFGRLTGQDITYPAQAADRRKWVATIKERL